MFFNLQLWKYKKTEKSLVWTFIFKGNVITTWLKIPHSYLLQIIAIIINKGDIWKAVGEWVGMWIP